MGVAYILAIMDQGREFDSLHWFETVTLKHEQDKLELQAKQQQRAKEVRGKKGARHDMDEDAVHTLQMTAKRMQQHKREFDLLFFSLSGARIFFKEAEADVS